MRAPPASGLPEEELTAFQLSGSAFLAMISSPTIDENEQSTDDQGAPAGKDAHSGQVLSATPSPPPLWRSS